MVPKRTLAPVVIVVATVFFTAGPGAASDGPAISDAARAAGAYFDSPTAPRKPQGRTVRDAEILPGIFLFDGTDVSLPTHDLRALGALVGDAEVVALGESVHTSGGYYRAKHRVFRYLVETLGFRVFAFESPWYDAELVREFVETCEGDAFDAVTLGLFGVWAAQSVVDLVEWMCGWNQLHPDDPVAFWGFDIQQPWDDGRMLFDFLEQAAPIFAPWRENLERCNGVGYDSAYDYYTDPNARVVDEEDHLACVDALSAVESFFDANEDVLVARTSVEALAWARINLVGIRSWENTQYHFQNDEYGLGMQSRDHGMAYVFRAVRELRNPDDRAAIWAHNWHIAFHTQDLPDFDGARSMGDFLRESFGGAYFVLGLVGYDVSINWPGVGFGGLPLPPSSWHVEHRLHHEIGRGDLLVDLAFGGTDEPFLTPGSLYFLNGWWLVPADHFDTLLYLDASPPMDALLWRDP